MYSPKEIAENYCKSTGPAKAGMSTGKLLLLGFMAGMYIALAAVGANTASATIENASVAKMVGALVFPTGLVMVLLAGSELFTGNCLLSLPVLDRTLPFGKMIRNWILVYFGNLIGGVFIALLGYYSGQLGLFGSKVAVVTIKTAAAKCALGFPQAILLGIGCNVLVCIAVWVSFAAKDAGGKVLAMYLPVMLFVLCGFEHCVANMYYVPAGLFAKLNPDYLAKALEAGVAADALNTGNFLLHNLLPVTIGNIIGGSVLVGAVYWVVYRKGQNTK